MNMKQAEKLLKQLAATAEVLAIAQASLTETNATLVDVLVASLASRANSDDPPQTMQ